MKLMSRYGLGLKYAGDPNAHRLAVPEMTPDLSMCGSPGLYPRALAASSWEMKRHSRSVGSWARLGIDAAGSADAAEVDRAGEGATDLVVPDAQAAASVAMTPIAATSFRVRKNDLSVMILPSNGNWVVNLG